MSVVPHSTEETETDASPEPISPSLRRVQGIASTALDRTKDATANALTASRQAWTKAAEVKRQAQRSLVAQRVATLADKTAAQTRQATAAAVVAAESTMLTCGGSTARRAAASTGKCVHPSTKVSGASFL